MRNGIEVFGWLVGFAMYALGGIMIWSAMPILPRSLNSGFDLVLSNQACFPGAALFGLGCVIHLLAAILGLLAVAGRPTSA